MFAKLIFTFRFFHSLSLALKALLCACALSLSSYAAADHSIVGVWLGTEVEIIGGDNPGVTRVTNPRLLIYTEGGHFMLNFELQDRQPGDSNQAIADAARNYNSWGGTYMVDGTDIIYIRRIAINPVLMQPENQRTVRQLRALTPTMLETSLTNDQGVIQVLRYRRVE